MADPHRFPQDCDEVGGALADADYLIATDVSDTTQSASGTVKKSLLSRLFTYMQSKYAAISEGGVAVADADTLWFIDATDSTEKRTTLDRLKTWLLAATDIGEAIADTDTFVLGNASASGAFRTSAASRLW